MSEDSMLKCLIAFVLGYLVARMMRGNGFSIGCPGEMSEREQMLEAEEFQRMLELGATANNYRTGGGVVSNFVGNTGIGSNMPGVGGL